MRLQLLLAKPQLVVKLAEDSHLLANFKRQIADVRLHTNLAPLAPLADLPSTLNRTLKLSLMAARY